MQRPHFCTMDANATSNTQTKSISNLLVTLTHLNRVSRAMDNVSLLPVTSKQFADPALLWTPTTTLQLQDRNSFRHDGVVREKRCETELGRDQEEYKGNTNFAFFPFHHPSHVAASPFLFLLLSFLSGHPHNATYCYALSSLAFCHLSRSLISLVLSSFSCSNPTAVLCLIAVLDLHLVPSRCRGPMTTQKGNWHLRTSMDSSTIVEMNRLLGKGHVERIRMTPFRCCLHILSPLEVNLKLLKVMVCRWAEHNVSFRVSQQLVPFTIFDVSIGLEKCDLDIPFDKSVVGLVGQIFNPKTTTLKELIDMFNVIVQDKNIEIDIVEP
ncbi:uncharacterized protein HKW66_Vig0033300 [Vigna angularis]|uniref:Uncharacterized protein n=1 Tax=Phaseolus angularis TaxID=3914 RepID=A0A8T0LCK4_PHAAN|nr:uncharacterized protein HKW66_Vig0033300 [Vigna angularis]